MDELNIDGIYRLLLRLYQVSIRDAATGDAEAAEFVEWMRVEFED